MASLSKITEASLPWESFDVLSLDIFDTTLARLCGPPESVFTLLEAQHTAQYGEDFKGFTQQRASIDASARRRAWEQRQAEEITLVDIYDQLAENWSPAHQRAEELAAAEERLEASVLYGLEPTRRLIQEARKHGKKVVFVSDMYLSAKFIQGQLHRCGFDDYDHLFVSSEEGCLKWSGKLYQVVEKQLNLPPNRFFHLGDNPEVDGEKARSAGWQSQVTPKPEKQLAQLGSHPLATQKKSLSDPASVMLRHTLIAHRFITSTPRENPFWYQLGFEYAAPLYYGFLRFILPKVKNRGLRKLYFLSRDGYFLKQLYDQITDRDDAYPTSQYLYASRRGLKFPAIEKLDPTTEDWLVEGIRLNVGQFFERMGMNPAKFSDHIRRYGFCGSEQVVSGGFEYDALRRLFREIEPAIIAAAKEERANYIDYLKDIIGEVEPFVMIDVGWNASLQKALKNIFKLGNLDRPIEGLYLGTYPGAQPSATVDSLHQAYLVNYGEPETHQRLIRTGVALIEFLFAAPETTFLRMRRTSDGSLEPDFHRDHENAADLEALAHLQNGITAFFEQIGPLAKQEGLDLPAEAAALITQRWLTQPTLEEATELSKVAYPDGWGGIFHSSQMADISGFWTRAGRPAKAKQHFKDSHWRPGYAALLSPLQRAILKIWHPAFRMDREV